MNDRIATFWGTLVEAALPFLQFVIEDIPQEIDPAELNRRLQEDVYPAIASVSATEQDTYIELVCRRWNLQRRTVRKEVGGHEPEAERARAATKDVRLHGSVLQDEDNFYFTRLGEDVARLSSFVFKPLERIVDEDQAEHLRCEVQLQDGRKLDPVVVPPSAWVSRNDFVRCWTKFPDMQWTGTSDHVTGVLALCSKYDVPRVQGTHLLGRIATPRGPRWVWPDGVLGPDGPENDNLVRYVGDGIAAPLRYRWLPPDAVRPIAARVLPKLFELHTPDVVLALLGWYYATAWAPSLRRLHGSFPVLWIWGSYGSGKSALGTLFARLVGVDGEPSSLTSSRFTMTKSLAATESIPQVWDEYRSDTAINIKENVESMARRVYVGEIAERGRTDLTSKRYRLVAPTVIAGESMPSDPALCERLIIASPMKSDMTPARKEAYYAVQHDPDLDALAASWAAWSLRVDPATTPATLIDGRMGTYYEAAQDLYVSWSALDGIGTLSERPRKNLVAMTLGLVGFRAWAAELGVTIPDIQPRVLRAIVDQILGRADGDSGGASGGDERRYDALDRFLVACGVLARNKHLIEEVHYALVNGMLCVHLPGAFPVYLERRRAAGLPDETMGLPTLRRAVREKIASGNSYVVDRDKRVDLMAGRPPCLVIDPRRAEEEIRLEEWPCAWNRTQGGKRPVTSWLDPGRQLELDQRSAAN